MATRAYDEEYVTCAQRILGDAVDHAVMTLNIDPDVFARLFAVSDASRQFGSGNPGYVAGMNGCELVRKVLMETGMRHEDGEDILYYDKGPEYWAGWALAFYQWYSDRSFTEILSAVPLSRILQMYEVYHQMDILHFAEQMQEFMTEAQPLVRLKQKRENAGLSQSELAAASGVPLRQIQLFEQRQRDINKTSAETLLHLSKVLHCRMEELLEK